LTSAEILPGGSINTCLSEDDSQQALADVTFMGVWNLQSKLTLQHERVIGAGIRSLKSQLAEVLDKITALDRSEAWHYA
jgi:hypothetical protein